MIFSQRSRVFYKKTNSIADVRQLFARVNEIKADFMDRESERVEGPKNEEVIIRQMRELTKYLDDDGFILPKITWKPKLSLESLDFTSYLDEKVEHAVFNQIFKIQDFIPNFSIIFDQSLARSRIIQEYSDSRLLKKWISGRTAKNVSFRLIYSGFKDGFDAAAFHKKCDGKPNTLTIIKDNQDNVFGGFWDKPWESKINSYLHSNKAWLFNLKVKEKYKIVQGRENHAGLCGPLLGPSFGDDLKTSIDFKNVDSHCNGLTYKTSDGIPFSEGRSFTIKEIEIYQIVKISRDYI